ncbi:MAG: hypothetical protein ACOYMM_05160 [Phycisphaerales bacterium]|jgi:hypothetical protein
MSAIRLNGQYVLLRDVEKKDFLAFVQLCLPKITAEEPVPHTMANVLAGLLAEGKPQTDPVAQAGFQCCASLGIKNMWTDGATANVTEEVATDASQGLETAFGFAAIQSGVAAAAAACNAFRRKITINDVEHAVTRQPKEILMQVAQAVANMKNVNEPIFVTAGRALGGRLKEGFGPEDPHTMAILCMLTDFGATGVKIDLEKNLLGFAPFSHANAMASAILQGLDAEKVGEVRKAIERTNEQFRKVMAQQQAAAQGQAGAAPQGQQQQVTVPRVMGTRRRR